MLLIGRNFYYGLDPLTVDHLATDLQIPAGIVKERFDMFVAAHLLLPVVDARPTCLAGIRRRFA
jgi:hypothetical protein